MDEKENSRLNGLQGLVALVGITLGVIPLIQLVFSGGPGKLLSWAVGSGPSLAAYGVSAAISFTALMLVTILERKKRPS